MEEKKKHPIIRMKKLSREKITRIDKYTFYCPSTDPHREPYLVYNSMNIGWNCDCMNFTLNVKDNNNREPYECKHIIGVKNSFFNNVPAKVA